MRYLYIGYNDWLSLKKWGQSVKVRNLLIRSYADSLLKKKKKMQWNKLLVIKTSDKKYERRFDRSTVIFKLESKSFLETSTTSLLLIQMYRHGNKEILTLREKMQWNKLLVIKTNDKKYERRFDRSTVIIKLEFMNKNSAYIQFLKQWDEGKS